MSETIEVQSKRLVLGKDWFHAIKRDPKNFRNSSMPGNTPEASYTAYLFNSKNGGRCCVGQYLKNICGIADDTLESCMTAAGTATMRSLLPNEAEWLIGSSVTKYQSKDANLLYEANDGWPATFTKNLTPEEFKEEQRRIIRETFAKHNIEVVFED